MQNIALTGLARAGKDTVAARLVEQHGYVRVAFADALKESALKADPIVVTDDDDWDTPGTRLSAVVEYHGWEAAKDRFPEVRRFLQHYGQAVREIDPMFWIKAVGHAVRTAWADGRPVVVTDVRYRNEAAFLANRFSLVRIERPGLVPGDHASEREMLDCPVSRTLVNGGSVEALVALADSLVY